jgi:transglutaminase-like putative cysteine protease
MQGPRASWPRSAPSSSCSIRHSFSERDRYVKYRITHSTTYTYTEAVPICHNQVYLTPRDLPHQTCRLHRLVIKPHPPTLGKRWDYFGNQLNCFSLHEGHHRLTVTAHSKVTVRSRPARNPAESPPWEQVADSLRHDTSPAGLDAYQFVFDSPHIAASAELADYARSSFTPGRPILEAVLDLTSRIHADFRYDTTATTVHTPLSEVFRIRRGVCQDLAHVQIGCLRSIGLAARYVSGYVRTHAPPGRARLVGADASHAWLALYCGPLGWVDIDPTNDLIPSADHITLAWGRDYGDVCPIKGLYIGGGQHTMSVNVDVTPISPTT